MRTALRTAHSRLMVSPTMFCQMKTMAPTRFMAAQTAGLGYDAPAMILRRNYHLLEAAKLDGNCTNHGLDHFLFD